MRLYPLEEMSLAAGKRLGPYEVLAPLGAGGMGEVWRARDTRLSREVALKVLPAAVALDRERLNRFEQEARAASALNHPNIVAIYDVGRSEDTSFIAMELVEGKTVRELLIAGPLSFKRALSIAAQAADGLAKAHAAGIVHRDLKPENLMVSSDGFVKILDFGLAKLVVERPGGLSDALTMAGSQTASGVIVGTVGYMSPEQASAVPLDFRSDQFSLGSILYEMLTGTRAFARSTVVDTLSAILHEEPEPIGSRRPETPVALRWLVERCLAKEPDDRYASTRDLARDLAMLRDHLSEAATSGVAAAIAPRGRRRLSLLASLLAGGAVLVAGGLFLGKRLAHGPPASYRQLTFRQGTIRSARFSPDGQSVVYTAAWGGASLELFAVRPGAPESRSLGPLGANELAVSSSGEIALVVRNRYLGLFPGFGTLARMPFEGGASPREVLENVSFADWSPDGTKLTVVRQVGTLQRLEYPIGKVLYETAGWISHPRISPDGRHVAFLDHPIVGDDRGSVALADSTGKRTFGGMRSTAWGLAWSAGGKEIWFTAATVGSRFELRAVSPSGRERLVAGGVTPLMLHDISRDGRVLLTHDNLHFGTLALPPAEKQERELSWLDLGTVTDISPDGRKILLNESGEGGGSGYSIYLRGTDGSPAVRLGPGSWATFSPDGKTVLTTNILAEPSQLVLLHTGAGEPVELTHDRLEHGMGRFLPDGERVLFLASDTKREKHVYVQPIGGGEARSISSSQIANVGMISPDGRFTAAPDAGGKLRLWPTAGGESFVVPGILENEQAIQWSPDAAFLYVFRNGTYPGRVFRVDVRSGKRELWREVAPSDPTGVVEISLVTMTPDASAYAYTYVRFLSDLFVAEGLK